MWRFNCAGEGDSGGWSESDPTQLERLPTRSTACWIPSSGSTTSPNQLQMCYFCYFLLSSIKIMLFAYINNEKFLFFPVQTTRKSLSLMPPQKEPKSKNAPTSVLKTKTKKVQGANDELNISTGKKAAPKAKGTASKAKATKNKQKATKSDEITGQSKAKDDVAWLCLGQILYIKISRSLFYSGWILSSITFILFTSSDIPLTPSADSTLEHSLNHLWIALDLPPWITISDLN